MVVVDGVTVCVPPEVASVKLLPSEPDTVTSSAFVALTVSVAEEPVFTVVGFAAMVTVGADAGVAEVPQPVTSKSKGRQKTKTAIS